MFEFHQFQITPSIATPSFHSLLKSLTGPKYPMIVGNKQPRNYREAISTV